MHTTAGRLLEFDRRVQSHMRYRYSYLLAASFALILGHPLLEWLGMDPGVYGLLGMGVFAAGLYAVIGEGRLTTAAYVLAIAAIACSLFASGLGSRPFYLAAIAVAVAFMGFVTMLILRSVMTSERVTIDTLYGAVAGYVLLGITWGTLYFLVEFVSPASFHSTTAASAYIKGKDFTFFSFVTLTTIGYGDMVPISSLAKSLVIVEAVTGIMYPAVMIGRLIAMHSANPRDRY